MLVTGNSALVDLSPPPFLSVGLAELFREQVRRTPTAPALSENGQTWSYQELYDEASRLAVALRAEGIGTEDAVGLYMQRSAPMVIATLAAVLAGAIYVPLDPTYPTERLAMMSAQAQVKVLLTSDALLPRATFSNATVRALSELTATGDSATLPATDPQQAVCIMFTSGSTGQPKGITVLHQGIARVVVDTNYVNFEAGMRVAHAANPSFDGSPLEIWGALLNGCTLVVFPRETVLNPPVLADAIRDEQIDVLFLTTALFNQMAYHDPLLFSTLRYALFGGEAADAKAVQLVLANKPPAFLINGYGPAESTIFTLTYTPPDVAAASSPLSIGTPINYTTAYIVGEDGQLVADGEEGELYVGGLGLARGYSHRPDLTADRFIPDTFSGDSGARLYRSGDIVRRRADGLVDYLGRNDTQVKIRGYRIELGEIEAVLQQHPAVRQAVVMAQSVLRDDITDKRLVAFIVPNESDNAPDAADLQAYLTPNLPAFMVPRLYHQVAQLPVTPNGKVDRRALEALIPAAPEATHEPVTFDANGDLLPALAALWERLLGVTNVQPDDNFILLGGHSLLITRLASRIREQFKVNVTLPDLFSAETLAELAALIERRRTEVDPLALPPLTHGEAQAEYPLSFPQERIWFLSQLLPDNLAYNFQMSVRWQGDLQVDVLQKTFTEIIRRHEILHSTFHGDDGIPVMRVRTPFEAELPIVDMTHIAPEEREATIEAVVQEGVQVVFDLTQLPLVKWVLYRFAPDDHVLLQVEHHFIHDGWSLSVLLNEIKALYSAYVQGQPSPLPEMKVQFGDFTLWQREVVSGDRYQHLRDYWGRQLADYPTAMDIPIDRPRPAQQSMRGDVVKRDLSVPLYHRLKKVAQQEGATFYMVLMAAFKSMLYRYTQQSDLVVGTGVANRRVPESEALLGMVVNTLILRTRVAGDEPFTDLLRRVKATTVEAYAHQDMPFERVVEMLQPARDLSHIPLYQVMFSFHDSAIPKLHMHGVTGKLTERHNRTAKSDLNIIVIPRPEQQVGADEESDERVTLWWEYSTDVFDHATIESLQDHYIAFLEAIADAPSTPIAQIPLRLASDDALYERINDTTRDYPRETPLGTLFEAVVAQSPDAVAVVEGETTLTYSELNRRANRLAHALQAQGVKPHERVGLWMERSADTLVAMLAVVKLGATYLPLDPTYPADRLAFMVADSQPVGILRHARVGALPVADVPVWQMDDPAFTADMSAENPPTLTEEGPIAYVMYTSGSTGKPKGILIPHRGVARLVLNSNYLTVTPADGVAHMANTAFDASTFETWTALLNGARVVIMSKNTALNPQALGAFITAHKVTVMLITTALFNQIAATAPTAFKDLRVLIFGGEAADAHAARVVLANNPALSLANVYGPTEGTSLATYYPITALDPKARTVPIGYPIGNTQVSVWDGQDSRLPVGGIGELVMYGDGVAQGYLNRPDLTAERFGTTEDGVRYYRTGDMVRLRRDGAVDFVGRRDGQIKLRGFRIELGEIEQALLTHPAIGNATVILVGQGDARQLAAYWVGTEELSTADLRAYLRPHLPDYMLPALSMRLDVLPLTPNGKIDRAALPTPNALPTDGESVQAATTESEIRLVPLWQSVLGREDIGANAHFFEVGGHSLLATRVVARVREQWGLDIPLALLFQHPVLSDFAAALDGFTTSTAATMPDLRAESDESSDDAELQAQLDALSPEELAALLADMEQ